MSFSNANWAIVTYDINGKNVATSDISILLRIFPNIEISKVILKPNILFLFVFTTTTWEIYHGDNVRNKTEKPFLQGKKFRGIFWAEI